MAGRLHLRLLGPWGLAWRQGRRELPLGRHRLPEPAQRARSGRFPPRRSDGARPVSATCAGSARAACFESLKEWVPGDETRAIDWKATARRGKLMARQYEDERRQQVMMVIDAGRLLTAEIDGRSRLEAAIDAALELAHSAVQHDDNVGLLVFADDRPALRPADPRPRVRCGWSSTPWPESRADWSNPITRRRSPTSPRATASARSRCSSPT